MIRVGDYVKVYDLCTGKITISRVLFLIDKDEQVECWRGQDEVSFENEDKFYKIKLYTAIWDKRERRYCFRLDESGCACFSNIIIDNSHYLECLLVDNEEVSYEF